MNMYKVVHTVTYRRTYYITAKSEDDAAEKFGEYDHDREVQLDDDEVKVTLLERDVNDDEEADDEQV